MSSRANEQNNCIANVGRASWSMWELYIADRDPTRAGQSPFQREPRIPAWTVWPRLCLLGEWPWVVPSSQAKAFYILFLDLQLPKRPRGNKSHSWESDLLLSAGIFKATVKDSDRSGCSGLSIFPSVTLHCPVAVHASDSWEDAAVCLGWDDPIQQIVTLSCYLTFLFGK